MACHAVRLLASAPKDRTSSEHADWVTCSPACGHAQRRAHAAVTLRENLMHSQQGTASAGRRFRAVRSRAGPDHAPRTKRPVLDQTRSRDIPHRGMTGHGEPEPPPV